MLELFLKEILGDTGTQALKKASEVPELKSSIIPCVILAWLNNIELPYSDKIPGISDSKLLLTKSESSYTGSVTINGQTWAFNSEPLHYITASIALSIGKNIDPISDFIEPIDVTNLNKSIQCLIKTSKILNKVKKEQLNKVVLDPSLGYKISHEENEVRPGVKITKVNAHTHDGKHVGAAMFAHHGDELVPGTVVVDDEHRRKGIASALYAHAEKATGKKVTPSSNLTEEGSRLWEGNKANPQFGKTEPIKGKHHEPKLDEHEPHMPQTRETKAPKSYLPKVSGSVKLIKNQLDIKCFICGEKFFEDMQFVGCMCTKELKKSIKIQSNGDEIKLSHTLDEEELDSLKQILAGK